MPVPPTEIVQDALDLVRYSNTKNTSGMAEILGKYLHGTSELEAFIASLGAISSHAVKELAELRGKSIEVTLDELRRRVPGAE